MLDREKLGKGLESLLGNIMEAEPTSSGTLQVDPNLVQPNPHQPRKDFDPDGISSLMESIKEHGMLQPIIVRPVKEGYQLVAGERRWRAAKQLGLRSIPAILKEASSQQALEMALVENIQREDLNPIEKARAFWELVEVFGLTQEAVGRYTGLDRSSVANTLRLLELPIEVQEHVSRGTISQGHARALLALRDETLQKKLCQRILDEGLSVREVEAATAGIKGQGQHRSSPNPPRADHVLELEDRLRRSLGTKVQIINNNGQGRIVIHFHGTAQFEHLMQMLAGRP